jgi:hypothetical protein
MALARCSYRPVKSTLLNSWYHQFSIILTRVFKIGILRIKIRKTSKEHYVQHISMRAFVLVTYYNETTVRCTHRLNTWYRYCREDSRILEFYTGKIMQITCIVYTSSFAKNTQPRFSPIIQLVKIWLFWPIDQVFEYLRCTYMHHLSRLRRFPWWYKILRFKRVLFFT